MLGGLSAPAYSLQQPRAAVARMALPAAPDFSFGVIADVQWADAPDGSNFAKTVLRCYRGAFTQLTKAVDFWNTLPLPPSYIAQLGDLIDGINQKANLDQSERALGMAVAASGLCFVEDIDQGRRADGRGPKTIAAMLSRSSAVLGQDRRP